MSMKQKKSKELIEPQEELVKDKKYKEKIIDIESEPEEKKTKVKVPKKKKEKRPQDRAKLTTKYFKKVTGKSIDALNDVIQADYAKVIERALQLSNIEKGDYSAPILITVPDAFHHGGKVNYRLDKKEDNTFTLIYDQALIYVLFFGKNSLFYYQSNINHMNGHIASDIAGEFSYSDVVHIETELKYDHVDHPKYITLDLEVGLVDGTIVPFHLRNHRIHQDYNLPTMLTNQEQQVLSLLKKKVRESRAI